jgi:hypothetical protein
MKRLSQTVVVSVGIVLAAGLLGTLRDRSAVRAAQADAEFADFAARHALGPFYGREVLIGGAALPEDGKRGKLETADDTWIRIRGKNGQLYCYPAAQLAFIVLAEEAKP